MISCATRVRDVVLHSYESDLCQDPVLFLYAVLLLKSELKTKASWNNFLCRGYRRMRTREQVPLWNNKTKKDKNEATERDGECWPTSWYDT
jgi:hypothetical protein